MKPSCCRNLSTSRQGKAHSWPYQTTQQIRIKGNERIWTFLGVEFVFNLHQSQHSQRTAFESCCPSFVLAIQTFGVCTSNIWWRLKKKEKRKKKSLSLLLKFQSEECLTDRAQDALPTEITTKAPGALIAISAGLGKQHLIRLQIK